MSRKHWLELLCRKDSLAKMRAIFLLPLAAYGTRCRVEALIVPSASTTGTVNDSNHDLSQHFCRLYRHASVLADGRIYMDGGNIYIPSDNGTLNTSSAAPPVLGMSKLK